ncbi:D-alanyl-D-alanine endopeptidase [Sulfurisoma sediminicola]|nr:D-alanyl-D-alanine endopeptidase [Sulfurisoma sediminicola]
MRRAIIALFAVAGLATLAAAPVAAEAASKKKTVAAKKHVTIKAKPAARSHATRNHKAIASLEDAKNLSVQSASALVLDQATGAVLYEKNAQAVLPIASITKLMTAMVALDAKPDLNEILTVSDDDVDVLKGTRSRLKVGTQLSREEMLRLALMSSENRAASALSRHYPGGRDAFVAAMNQKAQALGMGESRFEDPTGLTAANVSSARDLVKMVDAAHRYPLIREFSTTPGDQMVVAGRTQQFNNTNSLVKSPAWEIGLSKTGYINEAGKCLVMQAWLNNKPTIIVLLDSWGKMTRIGDANRIKRWIESAALPTRPISG